MAPSSYTSNLFLWWLHPLLPPSYKEPGDYIRIHPDNPGQFPHKYLIPSTKFLWHSKQHNHRFQGLRSDILGDHLSANHPEWVDTAQILITQNLKLLSVLMETPLGMQSQPPTRRCRFTIFALPPPLMPGPRLQQPDTHTQVLIQQLMVHKSRHGQNGHHQTIYKQYMLERMWRKGNPLCTVGENVNWHSHYGEQYGRFLQRLGIRLPYDPRIQLLDINPVKEKWKWKWKSLSQVQLFVTPWTIHSTEFSRPEYWSG